MEAHQGRQPQACPPGRGGVAAVTQRIYLAGPMTGLPEHNFPAFHAEAARLRHLGCEISRVEEVRLPSTVPPTQDLELIRSSSCGWLLRPGLSASACGSCRGRRPPLKR
nr:DUF4406 domain-containing protein [Pseudomonas aeruginosa]